MSVEERRRLLQMACQYIELADSSLDMKTAAALRELAFEYSRRASAGNSEAGPSEHGPSCSPSGIRGPALSV